MAFNVELSIPTRQPGVLDKVVVTEATPRDWESAALLSIYADEPTCASFVTRNRPKIQARGFLSDPQPMHRKSDGSFIGVYLTRRPSIEIADAEAAL